MRTARGARRAMLAVLAALVGAGCLSGPPPESPPAYPGNPAVPAAPPGAPCATILAVGDSPMTQVVPHLRRQLDRKGWCATVVDATAPGTGPATSPWPEGVGARIDAYQPHILVAHFIGNSDRVHLFGTSALDAANRDATNAMVAAAQARGVPVHWVVPAASCYAPDTAATVTWARYRAWVASGLGGVTSKPDWGRYLTPTGVYSNFLRWPGGSVRQVRSGDCVHFTPLGRKIAAKATAASVVAHWPTGP